MDRYSVITTKLPREFVLLQGTGCRWRQCIFCDYHEDVSEDPFTINQAVIRKITGRYGVLDVINSGSAFELDPKTIALLQKVIREKQIHTVWFEMHYMYRNRLAEFASLFAPAQLKFRCGIETFDAKLRTHWKKGIPAHVTAEEVARYFQGVCLLCCTKGESKEHILRDIELAEKHFEYFSVNLFCNNHTGVKRDEELARWFEEEVYPQLKDNAKVEVLLNNTDLGVGEIDETSL